MTKDAYIKLLTQTAATLLVSPDSSLEDMGRAANKAVAAAREIIEAATKAADTAKGLYEDPMLRVAKAIESANSSFDVVNGISS